MFTCSKYDPHIPDLRITEVPHKIYRVVEVNVVVIIIICKRPDVKNATHAKAIANLSRMPESKINGMISPKTAPCHHNPVVACFIFDSRKNFMQQESVVTG